MRKLLPIVLIAIATPVIGSTPQTTEKPSDPGDKMICKRFADVGSLVSSHRECKTRRDWDRERENLRAEGPGSNSCRNSGTTGQC